MEIEEKKTLTLLPFYKRCSKCSRLAYKVQIIEEEVFFECANCQTVTKWTYQTVLRRSRISFDLIEKLVVFYLDRKTPLDVFSILKYNFIANSVNLKTIISYFSLFDRIVMKFYLQELDCLLFEDEVEIDESYLFKPKKSYAPHRNYANGQWIFGIFQRKSSRFIIFPITSREQNNLHNVIFKFIKTGTTIYSDSFSVYVNNRVFPKKSKLDVYGYQHKFINHREEFVSSLFNDVHTNNIENVWKQLKQFIRIQRITQLYIPSIARFYFYRMISKDEQKRILFQGLKEEHLKKRDELIDDILHKF